MNSQSRYGWRAANTTGTCNIETGKLHLTSLQGDMNVLCLAQATQFDNLAFQAQLSIHQGDTAGLILRADQQDHQLYLFGITTAGRYLLATAQEKSGSQTQVIAGGFSSALRSGSNQTNRLTIIARQEILYLYANGQYLSKISDTTAARGTIGFFTGDTQQASPDAIFSNAKVWGV